jgi:hypothetical protein
MHSNSSGENDVWHSNSFGHSASIKTHLCTFKFISRKKNDNTLKSKAIFFTQIKIHSPSPQQRKECKFHHLLYLS